MSEPTKVTKSGDVLKDDKGAYAECAMCRGRVKMSKNSETGDMSGTCSNCGCRMDADSECIWNVKPGSGSTAPSDVQHDDDQEEGVLGEEE